MMRKEVVYFFLSPGILMGFESDYKQSLTLILFLVYI